MAVVQGFLFVILLAGHGYLVSQARASDDCNNLLADIVFILDSSGSVGDRNFTAMKNFLVEFVQKIESHVKPSSVRVAVIQYETTANAVFGLTDHPFASQVVSAINAIQYAGDDTYTHLALDLTKTILSSNESRPYATKLAVLLTDGKSFNTTATRVKAQELRDSGTRIMAIGIVKANRYELDAVASGAGYVYFLSNFSSLSTIQEELVDIACEPVCSWHGDFCWPGNCSEKMAKNCVCHPGFTLEPGTAKRCQVESGPELLTCRVTLKDSDGNEVRSRSSGTSQHCSYQQHEFMNFHPVSVVYDLTADLDLALGSFPYYISQSKVGVVGIKVKVTKISTAARETTVKEAMLNQAPDCADNATAMNPSRLLHCRHSLAFSAPLLADGEQLCIDIEAQGGGFYELQDYEKTPKGNQIFPTTSTHRRICFTLDSTKPQHCSQSGSCTRSPLQLSTRLTRSPDIRVVVDQWMDPVPLGGSASQVSEYILEVHGVDVSNSFLEVEHGALNTLPLNGSAPYDVAVTLPPTEPRMYAIVLEVHDVAGNVAYARRLVLYDNTSVIDLDPHHSLVVVSANPDVGRRWQSADGDVCVDLTDRFYNDVYDHYDYMLPVKEDSGREIRGQYDQISGTLPVAGTPSVRGVVKFEISWSLNGGAQFPWQTVQNLTAPSHCLPLTLRDGDAYDVIVRAYDVMNKSNTDDVRVYVDLSEPLSQELGLRGRWGRLGLHVHNSTALSTMVLVVEGSDPHSGLRSVVWSLATQQGGDDVGRRTVAVQRLNNTTSCGTLPHCYCPVVGTCETSRYNISFSHLLTTSSNTGDHHRHYFIAVNFTNNVGLTSSAHAKILIDVSPPTRGVVMEGLSDKGEVDFTSQSRVHVRWAGFSDLESGVTMYRVVLSRRCLTDQEMDQVDNATEVTAGTSTSFAFPSEGRYFTSVVAYNGALSLSPVACSDGVVYDTTPPRLYNVSISHARAPRSVACAHTSSTPWLVNSNLTRVPLANTTTCLSLCYQSNDTMVELDYLPATTEFSIGEEESDELCRSLPKMTDDLWIALPSDRLVVTWASEDEESEMEDFHVGAGSSKSSASSPDLIPYTSTHAHHFFHHHHSGLGHGAMFYLFIRGESKAGLRTQVTLGPLVVDSTPPEVVGALTAMVDGGQLRASWEKGAMVDLEQPRDVPLVITYRVGHSRGFLTSRLQLSSSTIEACRRQNSSLAGCIQFPLSSLHQHDAREPRDFFFQLHVQNLAGHVTTVNTSSARLPSYISGGLVLDVLPSAVASDDSAASDVLHDVDVILEPKSVCVAWSELHLIHDQGNTEVEVGIGTKNSTDDVIPFSFLPSTTTDVTSGRTCINVTTLPSYTPLSSVVKASNSDSEILVSSDGFVVIPRHDTANKLKVFSGRGCTESDLIRNETLPAFADGFNFSTGLPLLHPGENLFVAFDPFIPGVQFKEAVVISTTLTGYQVVVGSNTLAVILPAPASVDTSVRVLSCEKQQSVALQDDEEMTSSWEMQGPWTKFPIFLHVEILDRTCLQKTSTSQSMDDTRRCLLAERKILPHFRSQSFRSLTFFPGHSYVTSVAVCFADGCLSPVFSDDVLMTSRNLTLTINDAALLSTTSSELEVDMNVTVQPFLDRYHCVLLWGVSHTKDGSLPLSEWKLRDEGPGCSKIQIKEKFPYHGSGHGTLYICLRPILPWSAHSSTCKLITRKPQANVIQPFHVIELSQTTLRETDFTDYLHSQQLGNKLHDLYDLDLDFATSDLLLAAMVTNSQGREVKWFVMNEARLPNSDSCAGDADCVAAAESDDGTVVFSRQSTNFQHGTVYYVCVRILPRSADTQDLFLAEETDDVVKCGDGFVVDDERPVGGTVAISNAESGYLADHGSVAVTWEGFSDVENDVIALPDNRTLTFSVALGSYPRGADLSPFTPVGQRASWTFSKVPVSSGIFCYATVRAQDRVGHVTEVTSDAVILDNTPPSEGRVEVGSFSQHEYLSGDALHVTWEGIADPHSGIVSQYVAVSMRDGHDDVIPFIRIQGSSYTINGSVDMVDGHSYIVLLKSTNGAGLTTLTSSEPFVVDSSPPVKGRVWNGSPNEHVSYVTDIHTYSVHWSDFHDPHSGLAFYRVGLGTTPGSHAAVPFHNVALRTAYTFRRQFDQGLHYYATVEACNQALLCSHVSSSGVMFDNSPPTSGHVIVGVHGQHTGFYGHNTTFQAEWTGFSDPQSGIREFWWCVGTGPRTCDVTPFTTSLLTCAITGAVTSLPAGVPLYLTVRAVNSAGLVTDGCSESFLVDVTPPIVVRPPTFTEGQQSQVVNAQYDRSVLHVGWSFHDPDTPVTSVTVSVRGHAQGRQALQPITVGLDRHVTLVLDKKNLLTDGDVYVATVVGCNAAGLCTSVTSAPLLVDSSPPVVGTFLPQLPWAADSHSNGSVVTTLNVSWSGFSDEESKVLRYHFTVGRTDSDSDISGGFLLVPHDNSSDVQSLTMTFNGSFSAGSLVVLSVWAQNSIGMLFSLQRMTFEVELDSQAGDTGFLLLQRHSCSPHYCTGECTCATEGQVCQADLASPCEEIAVNSSSLAGFRLAAFLGRDAKELDFVTSAVCLEGVWGVTTQNDSSESARNVSRFEYSFSLANTAPGVGVMDPKTEPLWRDAGLRTSAVYCLPDQRLLLSGSSYVLHVRAWLSPDSYVTVQSSPLVADHSPPSRRRGRSVIESDSSCVADLDFVTQQSLVTSCWTGVFYDAQSNVSNYEVSVGSVPYGDDYQTLTSVGRNTSLDIDVTSMTEGTQFYVTVRAWNGAGLSRTISSDGFLRDHTPPVPGSVFLASRHAADHVTDDVTTLPVAWHGFHDLHSGVTSYSVALFDAGDLVIPRVDFTDVGFETKHVFSSLSLQHGHSYKAAVKAYDAAGLESSVVFSPAILVDVTPPEGATCPQFKLEKNSALTYTHTPSFRHETYTALLDADVPEKNHLLKIVVTASSLDGIAQGELTVEPLRIPLSLRYRHSQATAEHTFLAPTAGKISVGVTVRGKSGASIAAQLFSCSVPVVSSSEGAVTVQQVDLNTVSVSSTLVDGESAIMSLRVGLGSTPGGMQVMPLMPFGQGAHAVFQVSVQNGAQVYATVLAQNHADSWSRFVSKPVTMDTTPPVIDNLNVTISYTRAGGSSAVTSAAAVAEWTTHDAESGSVSCACELEGHETTDDVKQIQYDVREGQCSWRLVEPRHGARVRAVVSCVNGVRIQATPRFADATVVVEKTVLSKASLQFLPNWGQFSPYDKVSPGTCSATSDLEVTWAGAAEGATVDHFQYRFLSGQSLVSEWSSLPPYKTSAMLKAGEFGPGNVSVELRAVNSQGVTSETVSSRVRVDDSLPTLTGQEATAFLINKEILLNWTDVFETTGDVTYSVYAGSDEGYGDVINHVVTKHTSYKRLCDLAVDRVYIVVEAVHTNGLSELYKAGIMLTNN